jgi:hypothetical protein
VIPTHVQAQQARHRLGARSKGRAVHPRHSYARRFHVKCSKKRSRLWFRRNAGSKPILVRILRGRDGQYTSDALVVSVGTQRASWRNTGNQQQTFDPIVIWCGKALLIQRSVLLKRLCVMPGALEYASFQWMQMKTYSCTARPNAYVSKS